MTTRRRPKNNGINNGRRRRKDDDINPARGEVNKSRAIARANQGANPNWKHKALEAVRRVSVRLKTFTTDDVWQELTRISPRTKTAENRAMGAIMRAAAKEGWCEPTNQTRKTQRASNHRRPLTVWASKLIPSWAFDVRI